MKKLESLFDFSSVADVFVGENYKSAAFVSHVLKRNLCIDIKIESNIEINQIEYKNQSKFLFVPDVATRNQLNKQRLNINNQENIDKNNVQKLQSENNENKIIVTASNLYELINIIAEYDLICMDDSQFEGIIARAIGAFYISESSFVNSFEGNVWNKIFALQVQLQAGVMNYFANELYKKNAMPWVKYSQFKNEKFVEEIEQLLQAKEFVKLFELIIGFEPVWKPNECNLEFLNNAVILEKWNFGPSFHQDNPISLDVESFERQSNVSEKYVFDKSLIQYVRTKIAYIGNDRNIIEKLPFGSICIDYHPEFVSYEKWNVKPELSHETHSTYEEKLKMQGKLAKLHSHKLRLKSGDVNIYSYIKSCAVKEIKTIVANMKNGKMPNHSLDIQWKEDLQHSGIEYIKILNRAQSLIENFFTTFNSQNWIKVEFDKIIHDIWVDCYLESFDGGAFLILFSWSDIVYSNDVRIEKLINAEGIRVEKIQIITTKKIIDVDFEKEFSHEPKDRVHMKEDDLFYWYE